MRVNPHFRLGTHRMSKSNIWHRVLARNPLFAFFLPAHRARAKKVVWKSARPHEASATTTRLATTAPPPGAWPAQPRNPPVNLFWFGRARLA